ncbi:MAG: DUF916 domain-containing protein [Microbacteriaceae bacterium]|nr:DUF916 domain-containing protein [Microbacteriaceae bacterium]
MLIAVTGPPRHRSTALRAGHNFARTLTAGLALTLAVAGAVTLAPALSVTPVPAARAIDNGALGIRPSNGSDFFRLRLAPGSSVKAVAIVTNHTAQPVTLVTYPVDGATTANGSFILNPRAASLNQVGRWVQLGSSRLELPARSEKPLLFTIQVPQNASKGEYAGGVIIETLPVDGVTQGTGTAARVDVVYRQGVRIYLTVAADDLPRSSLVTTPKSPPPVGENLLGPAALLIVTALSGWGFVAWRARSKKSKRPAGAHR